MSKADGGPAFPRMERSKPDSLAVRGADVHYVHQVAGGMTMRQWYKGHAAAAIANRPGGPAEAATIYGAGGDHTFEVAIARAAGALADALLAEDAEHNG